MESKRDHDVIIIGAGPAGLTAAIYLTRSKLDVLVLTGEVLGGKASWAGHIDNYPGFTEGINGFELSDRMVKQAERFGTKFLMDRAASISVGTDGEKIVETAGGKRLTAYSLIVASGSSSKRLDVPGEKELLGRGVSFCATCDGPFFRDKEVVVVGGGNVAIEDAVTLANLASKVSVIHRRDELRATPFVQDELFALPNIEVIWDSVVSEILATDDKVSGVKVRNVITNEVKDVPCAGVFVAIGQIPDNAFAKGFLSIDEYGYIITDERMETHVPGVFAAGDIRRNMLKQVSVAVGEGSIAAISAASHIRKEKLHG